MAVRAAQDEAGPSDGKASQKTPLGLHISYQVCEGSQKLAKLLQFLQVIDQKQVSLHPNVITLVSNLLEQCRNVKTLLCKKFVSFR